MAVSGKDAVVVVLLIVVGYLYLNPPPPPTADQHLAAGTGPARPPVAPQDTTKQQTRDRLSQRRRSSSSAGGAGGPPVPAPPAAAAASRASPAPRTRASPAPRTATAAGTVTNGADVGWDPLPAEQRIRLITGSLASIPVDRTGIPEKCLGLISAGGCRWTRDYSCPAMRRGKSGVQQLRHHFGPSLTHISAMHHPTHAVGCVLLGAQAGRSLISVRGTRCCDRFGASGRQGRRHRSLPVLLRRGGGMAAARGAP